ncbi:hypothetical protein HZH66_012667 [Vespula vulgaris]|uniref:Uncharacterized protein n=1 Tax=Vespula vulgaris TaxID=7454 RepID=A0A834JC15_VESVU|nr:hypothetical protein HZH66_012667 [Vespula vulgaris]
MEVTTNFDEFNVVLSYKALLKWWNGEIKYLFRRIQRWTALATGYNPLRSKKILELTMYADHISIYHLKAEPRNKKKSNLFNEEEEEKEQGSNCLIKLQRSSEEEDDLEER